MAPLPGDQNRAIVQLCVRNRDMLRRFYCDDRKANSKRSGERALTKSPSCYWVGGGTKD